MFMITSLESWCVRNLVNLNPVEKCICHPNLVWFRKIPKIFLSTACCYLRRSAFLDYRRPIEAPWNLSSITAIWCRVFWSGVINCSLSVWLWREKFWYGLIFLLNYHVFDNLRATFSYWPTWQGDQWGPLFSILPILFVVLATAT